MVNLEEISGRKERQMRRLRLLGIIKAILSGKFDSSKTPLEEIFQPPDRITREYISPKDRNTNNYGFMEMHEMLAGNPNEK